MTRDQEPSVSMLDRLSAFANAHRRRAEQNRGRTISDSLSRGWNKTLAASVEPVLLYLFDRQDGKTRRAALKDAFEDGFPKTSRAIRRVFGRKQR